jgi:hypothetical protein
MHKLIDSIGGKMKIIANLAVGVLLTTSVSYAANQASQFLRAPNGLEFAESALPGERFEKLIVSIDDNLKGIIGDSATRDEIDALANGGVRNFLFRIQNLAEIYEKQYPSLSSIRKASKAFEDSVGAYREASEKLAFAIAQGAPPEKIDELKARVENQGASLVTFLEVQSWNPKSQGVYKLTQFRSTISAVTWQDSVKDRQFLYSGLCDVVRRLDKKNWDMSTDLDGPLGLHTLKKEVRWHRIEISLFKGDILSSVATCDNTPLLLDFDRLLEETNQLDRMCQIDNQLESLDNLKDQSNCQVSSCYLSRLDELYNLVSDLKDQAEGLREIGKPLPPGFLQPAQDMMDQIRKDRVLRMIGYELKSCANKTK